MIALSITAAAIIGAMVGFGLCAVLTAGRISDADDMLADADAAHERCASVLTCLQARRDEALAQVTPGANSTVKRMAAILRGDA